MNVVLSAKNFRNRAIISDYCIKKAKHTLTGLATTSFSFSR